MIAVSDSFKKAIKSDNREIHGYVDVVYNQQEGEYSVNEIPTISPLSKSDGTDLIDNIKKMKNYATLENNYFLLDGSFILANSNTLEDSGGYISDDIFSNIQNKTITLVSTETGYVTTKGFTIFFKDNIPFNFDITITTEYSEDEEEPDETLTINVRNNTRHNYQYIFDGEVTIKEFTLNIINTEYNDRRIRIPDISFSLTDVYEGEELVSFEINEEIDLLIESLPINTCTVNLNNYPNDNGDVKFDPINPAGIVQYLTEDTTIIPYIGVLTEENGIEYVPMGTFYLNDWSSDNDGNVTLNCQSLMARIINTEIVSDGTFLRQNRTFGELSQYLTNMTGYVFDLGSGGGGYWSVLQDANLGNFLLAILPFLITTTSGNIFYCFHTSRNNGFVRKIINDESIDSISQNNLLNDVKYETKSVINRVEIVDIESSKTSSSRKNVLSDTYTLQSSESYVWYNLNEPINYLRNPAFTYTTTGSGTATLIDSNVYMLYIKFTGNVGDTFTINYEGNYYESISNKKWIFTNDMKTGDTLSLDFSKYYNSADDFLSFISNIYLTKDKKYKITANTIGDPSLESGDTISIQTRYTDENDGYKDVIITKQKFTYDGGLSCELEGMGN